VTDTTGSRLAIISKGSGAAADFSITSPNYTGTSWTAPDIATGETLGANSLTLTSGGVANTIATTSGETYATLSGSINALDIAGLTATAGTDGTNTNLSITSSGTPFTISEPSFGFTQAVTGANASLVVDGVPIESATNTVTGAIGGVTLTLLNAEIPPTTTNLTVASDATQISTAINQFVTDYNTAIGLVNAQYTASSTGTEGVLSADPTVSDLQSTLMQALNYVSTPATGSTTASTLDSMGVSVGTDGTLTVDTTTLDNELINNPTDVQNFFQGTALNGFANSMTNALSNLTDPSDGAFSVDLRSVATSSAAITAQISSFETD
jgi:flagellar hook-associated protein 2